MKLSIFYPQNITRNLVLKGTACIGVGSSMFLSLLNPLSAQGQGYITVLGDYLYVTATAGMDTNNPTVITLHERGAECAQASGDPSRLQQCLETVRAAGMARTVYNVDCSGLEVTLNNDRTNVVHEIQTVHGPSRADYWSHIVFDYACGTNYANW